MLSFTKTSDVTMAAVASSRNTSSTFKSLQEAAPLLSMIGTATTSFLLENGGDGAIVHRNELGTINGCYVPCLLNIMGIVLFERLGWGVGHVGIRSVLCIYLVAELAAILTVLSLSAMVTNGNMRGGGSYYMISRTLGAEFGGSVGILFYCAYAVNIAFCCSGCAEEIIKTWFQHQVALSAWWLNLVISSLTLLLCLAVALMGARIFTKVNILLFAVIFTAISLAMMAGFARTSFVLPDFAGGRAPQQFEHESWSVAQLRDNWRITDCHVECGLCSFPICFWLFVVCPWSFRCFMRHSALSKRVRTFTDCVYGSSEPHRSTL